MEKLKKTPLYEQHKNLKARLVDFSGWSLPVWYTSILDEHNTVRNAAGLFDVSHMGRIRVYGGQASSLLDYMMTRPAQSLEDGSARLCLMCLEDGGILDDLWIYQESPDSYYVIWNSGDQEAKLDWLQNQAKRYESVFVENESNRTAMIAVQGPLVAQSPLLKDIAQLPPFHHKRSKLEGIPVMAARTGYTGEDGFEVIVENDKAEELWKLLLHTGMKPCGLGARDILRLEAGMMLYGQDMDTSTNPIEAGLLWLVDLDGDRDFIGKGAILKAKKEGATRKLIGFKMLGKEIPRHGYRIQKGGIDAGIVTSGGFAPSLDSSVGLGYVPVQLEQPGTEIEIIIRNKPAKAVISPKKFYRRVKNESKRK